MLFELVDVGFRVFVIHVQDPDEVGDGQHADELLLLRVPQRRGADAVVHQREKGLLHQELGVEDDLKMCVNLKKIGLDSTKKCPSP